MTNGTYGIRKPAFFGEVENNVDIFYHYRPTRGSEDNDFPTWKKGDASWLTAVSDEDGSVLPGMYTLRLPLEKFNKKGIYAVYIKPKEIEAKIYDVSTLTGNYANIRGIVIDTSALPVSFANGDLVGYRVEWLDAGGKSRQEKYRIITSNNRCEPVSQNVGGGTMLKSVRYRFNDSSTLMFCTVTPSSAMSFKSNAIPDIGTTNDRILLVNTKFNPVMMEIEMVEHDADTISTMLEGAQVRNLDNGIITTFDADGNIYHQAAYGNIINTDTGLHADFKIPYEDYIRAESDKFDEIKRQVTVNGQ